MHWTDIVFRHHNNLLNNQIVTTGCPCYHEIHFGNVSITCSPIYLFIFWSLVCWYPIRWTWEDHGPPAPERTRVHPLPRSNQRGALSGRHSWTCSWSVNMACFFSIFTLFPRSLLYNVSLSHRVIFCVPQVLSVAWPVWSRPLWREWRLRVA